VKTARREKAGTKRLPKGAVIIGPGNVPVSQYAIDAARAYLNELSHRRHRKLVLAAVLAFMAAKKVFTIGRLRCMLDLPELLKRQPEPQKEPELRNGTVTPVTAPAVTPVLYLDLDISAPTDEERADEITHEEICGITGFAGLKCLLLTEHGPGGGNPVYRIEGPLPQLISWLDKEYAVGGVEMLSYWLSQAKLAR
jgi:hypothetical protein